MTARLDLARRAAPRSTLTAVGWLATLAALGAHGLVACGTGDNAAGTAGTTSASAGSSSGAATSSSTGSSSGGAGGAGNSSSSSGAGGAVSSSTTTGGGGSMASSSGAGGSMSSSSGAGGAMSSSTTSSSSTSSTTSSSSSTTSSSSSSTTSSSSSSSTTSSSSSSSSSSTGSSSSGGALVFGSGAGSSLDDEGNAVALDKSGNVFAGGYAKASPDFGCGKVSAPGTSDAALVVKYGPTGTCAWSKLFGDAGAAASHVTGLASDLAGDVYVAGDIAGSIDFGGGKLTSGGGTDGYLAKLDANGGYLWAQRFGDAAEQLATRVTVDQGGNAVVIGTYQGTLDLGGGKSVTSAGAEDVFVAKWSPQGTVLWVKTFGGAGNQLGRDVVVDGSNAIFITGVNNGTIDLGAGPLVSAGMGDAFIAKLDANGVPQWSKEFGDGGDQTGTGVAVDAAGNLIVTGSFETKLDLGGGYVFTSLALHDVWLAKFDTGGKLLWGAAGQGADNQLSDDVGVDLSGNITIFGGFFGDINFGAPTTKMTTAGLADIFIARFSSAGTPLWASRFGDASSQVMKAGAVDLAGHSVGVGVCFGTVDFGAGPIVGHGGEDFCVAKFGP